ncbi:Hsp33 family molecular chaperone HslO [Solilutibacter silvestris]|uniref:Hsp33 family molecular chaperone HslO n=1 Tax=Solilutibacter silvestris TaxID=1645665 RepID=UPI003D34726D
MSDSSDLLHRFLLPDAHVRGAHVRLDATWKHILSHASYPEAVEALLGEALVASALLSAHTKVEGRLSLQARSSSALRTLFAECTAAGTLRGIARLADGEVPPEDLASLGSDAMLAVTIENPGLGGGEPMRYQGLVPLESPTLSGALEDYFDRSEQLPTRLILAADGERAAGLLLQALPGAGSDDDGWNRISLLAATLGRNELLDLPADILLTRLFHQETLQDLGAKPLQFGCSCSQGRVEDMLRALGREEAEAAAGASVSGQAEIICEFCGKHYHLSGSEIDQLFLAPPAVTPSSRLQ